MANIFTVTTVLISVPLAEMMFVYIATLWGGAISLSVPMLWALSFLATFLIGGVTGFLGRVRLGYLYARYVFRPRALSLHLLPNRHYWCLYRSYVLVS